MAEDLPYDEPVSCRRLGVLADRGQVRPYYAGRRGLITCARAGCYVGTNELNATPAPTDVAIPPAV